MAHRQAFSHRWRTVIRNWWHGLSPARQDRFVSLLPLLTVVVFAVAVLASMGYLRLEEMLGERQMAQRDADYALQRLDGRLSEQLGQLQQIGNALTDAQPTPAHFSPAGEKFVAGHPEVRSVAWFSPQAQVLATQNSPAPMAEFGYRVDPVSPLLPQEQKLLQTAATTRQPVYALVEGVGTSGEDSWLALAVPVYQQAQLHGFLYARYTLSALLYYDVPSNIYTRYAVSLLSQSSNRVLAGQALELEDSHPTPWQRWTRIGGDSVRVPLQPLGNAAWLHLRSYGSVGSLVNRGLSLLVLALCGLTVWMLLANWQHLRRRQQAQQALLGETAFRRAMENSLATGTRALDMQGRISHINAAFCRMTGWSEAELVSQMPPYPFWHPDDHSRHNEILNRTLRDRVPQGGYEMRVLRKNGSTFEARMYMTPLIGADGVQTGWMSSMTDITEPNRVKRQLRSAQARFARVLDVIDASVSVAPLGGKELLFANNAYREWFGDDQASGHLHMLVRAGSAPATLIDAVPDTDHLVGLPSSSLDESSSSNSEIFMPHLDKWIEVRSRYLEWVDGRLAQMVIATDISARRNAEELSAQHAERAQAASRLVTMGEMASSVAHELNQPLTAITNYCNGMASRLRNGQMDSAAMLGTLEKTSKQAQRAGQIIQRVRNFVKRSTPNYAPADVTAMVNDAVELAEIEMRRRAVRLHRHVSPHLPRLWADKILIEQVLVNLLRNAAEAIDYANMPAERREVRLVVQRERIEGKDAISFAIQDRGAGLSADALEHLFEAFYTTKAEGMGIGLNLCRSIVEAHHGRLHAQNLYNGDVVTGCCFTFWLPAAAHTEGDDTP